MFVNIHTVQAQLLYFVWADQKALRCALTTINVSNGSYSTVVG